MGDAKKLIDIGEYVGGESAARDAAASVRKLGRDITTLADTVGKDGARLKLAVDGVNAALKQLQTKPASLNLIDPADRKLLTDYIKLVGDLKVQKAVLAEQERAQKLLTQGLTDATKGYTSELAKLKAELRAAAQAQDLDGQKRAAAQIRALASETKEFSAALRGANSTLSAAAGSYDELTARNSKLLATLKALEGGLKSTSKEADQLRAEIATNNETLLIFDKQLGINYRNVSNYSSGFSGLVTELAKARAAQAGLAADSDDYARSQVRVSGFQRAAERSAAQMGLSYGEAQAKINGVTAAIQPLTTNLIRLEREQREVAESAGKESEACGKLGFQIAATRAQIDQVADATANAEEKQDGLTKQLGFSAQGLKEYVTGLAVGAIGLQALAQAALSAFQSNVDYSRQISEVRKTTSLTADEADRLGASLKMLDTPTSVQGLLKIASVGGQLGVAKDNLFEFTQSVDVAVQALGNDFQGGAEQIAEILGRLSGIFKGELGPDQAKNILAVGSAINSLANEGSASAPFLAEVAGRVGAIATANKLGLKDVLAFSSVLQEQAFTAETSGTALNSFFSTLSTKSKAAFEIAKKANPALTLKEFRDLINNDFSKAIDVFFKGLIKGGQSTTALNRELATLKLESGETKNVIIALAKSQDDLAEAQKTANDQLRDATSLSKEAKEGTDNLGSSVDKLLNNIKNKVTGGTIGGALKTVVDFFNGGILYQEKFTQSLEQTVDKTVNVGQASKQLANDTLVLLSTYDELAGKASRSADEQQRLAVTVLGLKDKLGDSVVTINKQTGAYELNTEAVKKAGLAQSDLAQAQVLNLARQLQVSNEQRKAAKQAEEALSKSVDTRSQQLISDVSPEQLERIQRYLALVKEGSYLAQAGLPVAGKNAITPEQVELVKRLQGETDKLGDAGLKLERIDSTRATLLAGLKRLGFDELGALRALAAATGEVSKKTDDGIDKDKKKKQSLADVLKAEYELQKFRLEQKAKDFDRQGDNVANTDEVRTRAIEKAVAARKQIAKLDELEEIHAAELKNAKLVGGDQALALERTLINERFQAKVKELDRDGLRALVALRQATADQLADIEKQELDTQAKALEVIGADEQNSATERQSALLTASAKRIEIIYLESDIKRRAAKGDAELLKKIDAEQAAAVTEQLKKTRANNADLANDDLEKRYRISQLALEKSRAAGIFTEKQYYDQVDRLDLAHLKVKLENYEKDTTKQQEAADLRVEIAKRENDKKNKIEQEAAEKKQKIYERSIEAISGLSQAGFSFQSAVLQAQATNEQESYENQVKAAGENKELLLQVERKHAKESAEIKRKQAENDRRAALFSILINTAQAVVRDAKEFPFPLSLVFIAADVAIGAIQAATVLSAPLPTVPAYFKGRKGGPAEFAIVGDRGPELVERVKAPGAGGGSRFEIAHKPTVTRLNAGDNVFTASESEKMMRAAAQQQVEVGQLLLERQPVAEAQQVTHAMNGAAQGAARTREAAAGVGMAEILQTQRQVVEALKKFKPTTVTVHRGADADIETSQSLTHYLSQRTFASGNWRNRGSSLDDYMRQQRFGR